MKVLRIDEDAHHILLDAKELLKERGIEKPNISDAIRELRRLSGVPTCVFKKD